MTGRYKAYSEYKDSNLEWLGEVPEHWSVDYSKWLFEERNNKAKKTDEMLTASQKYGVIPQKMFMELEQQKVVQVQKGHDILKQVKKNDFVISMRSFQGGIEFCGYDGAVSSAYVPLEPQNEYLSGFFKYLFKSKPYIQALQATTNLVRDGQALRYTNFIQVRLPVPTKREAVSIGEFLDHETAKIDTLITKQEKLIELLKEKRQAVISHAVTKGLNPDTPMKDSGVEWLGEVPEHWIVSQIKYGYKITLGKMLTKEPKSKDYELKPYLKAVNVQPNGVDVTKVDKMWFSPKELKSLRLKHGDVLISEGGDVGRAAIWNAQLEECYIQNALNRARPINSNSSIFLLYWMTFLKHTEYIDIICNKATIAHYTAEKVEASPLIIPPLKEQRCIAQYLNKQSEKFDLLINKAYQAIQLMKERKSALISAAVTGKIDVRDWQGDA